MLIFFFINFVRVKLIWPVPFSTHETRRCCSQPASSPSSLRQSSPPDGSIDTITLQWKLLVRKRDAELCSFVNRQLVLPFHSWKLCGTEVEMQMHTPIDLLKIPVRGRIMSTFLRSCEKLYSWCTLAWPDDCRRKLCLIFLEILRWSVLRSSKKVVSTPKTRPLCNAHEITVHLRKEFRCSVQVKRWSSSGGELWLQWARN